MLWSTIPRSNYWYRRLVNNLEGENFYITNRARRVGLLNSLSNDNLFNWLGAKIINYEVEESEDSKTMTIKINVPGCTKDDLNVTWSERTNILEVTHKDKDSSFHYAQTIGNCWTPLTGTNVKNGVLTIDFERVDEDDEDVIQLL